MLKKSGFVFQLSPGFLGKALAHIAPAPHPRTVDVAGWGEDYPIPRIHHLHCDFLLPVMAQPIRNWSISFGLFIQDCEVSCPFQPMKDAERCSNIIDRIFVSKASTVRARGVHNSSFQAYHYWSDEIRWHMIDTLLRYFLPWSSCVQVRIK